MFFCFLISSFSTQIDFSQFHPTIPIQLVLCGFQNDDSIQTSFSEILSRFLSTKRHGGLNISLSFSVNQCDDTFIRSYYTAIESYLTFSSKEENEKDVISIYPDSEITNIISNAHSQAILASPNNEKFTLFFVNHSKSLVFRYGDAKDSSNCIIFDFRSGLCHANYRLNPKHSDIMNLDDFEQNDKNDINTNKNNNKNDNNNNNNNFNSRSEEDSDNSLSLLFDYTSKFVDEILFPDLYRETFESPSPSRIVSPVVTFGPKISLSKVQSELNSLFSPIETLLIVNRQNLYEFPIVATSQLSTRIGTLFEALKTSEHVFGSSLSSAINETSQRVVSSYVFPSEIDSLETDEQISVIFSCDDDVEKLLLTTLIKTAGNLNYFNRMTVFGGHHPFLPFGGVNSFSSIISDVLTMNFALSNIEYARLKYFEVINKMEEVKTVELPFLNISLPLEYYETLQRMIERTSNRIQLNENGKALSSSVKAAEVALEMVNRADELLIEASIFGQCCPETVYVSRKYNMYVVAGIIITFFVVVFAATYKVYTFWQKKRFTPQALR